MKSLRVLIEPQYLNGGLWYVAQCLEHDLAVQARSAQEAHEAFVALVRSRCSIAVQKQIDDPFQGIKPAPKRFESAWEGSLRVEPRPEVRCGSGQIQPYHVESRVT